MLPIITKLENLWNLVSTYIYCVTSLMGPQFIINSFKSFYLVALNKDFEALPFFLWPQILLYSPTSWLNFPLLTATDYSVESVHPYPLHSNLEGLIIPLKANPSNCNLHYTSHFLRGPCFISCLLYLEFWPTHFYYIIFFLNKAFRSNILSM